MVEPRKKISRPTAKSAVESDVRTRTGLPVITRTAPSSPPPEPRASKTAATQPMPAAAISAARVLVVGARPTEIGSVARSFTGAGARVRTCLDLAQLDELLRSTRWACLLVDLRWQGEVTKAAQGASVAAPMITYAADSKLGHRARLLPLGEADAAEILRTLESA